LKIYYDGNNPREYEHSSKGFTTNTSFFSQSGCQDYEKYISDYLDVARGRPCSFQIWSDLDEEIVRQSSRINSMGQNIFVKIPIIKCNGEYNLNAICAVLDNGINVNVTAVHTEEQIDSVLKILPRTNSVIVSVFAGGVTDCGVDPVPLVRHAVAQYKPHKNVEVLWAGCQTNLHIVQARESGCHIITVPDSIMKKIDRMKLDIKTASIKKVNKFMEDAIESIKDKNG